MMPRITRFAGGLGLTPRLMVYMVIVAAIPVVLIGVFSFMAGSKGIRQHTKSHLISVVILKSQEIERWFRPLEASANVLAGSTAVRDKIGLLIESEIDLVYDAAWVDLSTYFNDTIQRLDGLKQISIVTPEGHVLLTSSDPSPVRGREVTLPPAYASLEAAVHFPPYISGRGMKPAVISVPVLDGADVLAHILMEASTIPMFETLSPDAGLGPNAKIYLVNDAGELHSPLQVLPQASAVVSVEGLVAESGVSSAGGQIYADVVGTQVVGAYELIEPLGLRIVAEVPVADAYSDIHQMRWAILAASGAFLVLAMGVALILTRSVTRPMKTLMKGTGIIGTGGLSHRIEIGTRDEIGQLAQSFNHMASDLKANIEDRMAERDRSEAELEGRNQELEEASRAKSHITATVSHELKTPLTGIIGYVELMLGKVDAVGPLTERQLRYLNIVNESSYRLKALIEELLAVSRIESHSLDLGLVALDLGHATAAVVGSMEERFEKKGMRVTLDMSPGLPPACGDQLRFAQIMENLLSNAHKYAPEGSVVTVSAREEGEMLRIDVADRGMGISTDD